MAKLSSVSQTSRQAEKAAALAALHAGEPFVIPNPWDAGSARLLAALGFRALATTSSGFAFTLGRRDGGASLEEVVEHVAALEQATELPLSVDLENGYGREPEDVARAIRRVAAAGAVGASIEDFDPDGHLYELPRALERITAAVAAARSLGFPFVLTARAENHIAATPISPTRSSGCRPSKRPVRTRSTRQGSQPSSRSVPSARP